MGNNEGSFGGRKIIYYILISSIFLSKISINITSWKWGPGSKDMKFEYKYEIAFLESGKQKIY